MVDSKNKEIQVKIIKDIDYDKYSFPLGERFKVIFIAFFTLLAVGLLLYRNLYLSLILASFSILAPKIASKRLIEKRKKVLQEQFLDGLDSLSSALSVGLVSEKAFDEALKDLKKRTDTHETSYIINEFESILIKYENGTGINESLRDFKERANVPSISDFVDVFIIANENAVNINEVIKNSIRMITDKMEIDREIAIIVAGKKIEQNIMSVAPIGFVAILSVLSGDYMEPVFTTIGGHILMTVVLGTCLGAYWISSKIMNIGA